MKSLDYNHAIGTILKKNNIVLDDNEHAAVTFLIES